MSEAKRSRPGSDVEYVSEASGLDALCAELRRVGTFAFDTEFIKEETFEPLVCLMQVATHDRVYLVDPLADGLDVGPLWCVVGDAETLVVVHAGMEDMALCRDQTGRPPEGVFDVQIASGLVGIDYPLSLARLLREMMGVRLHKSQTLSDWGRRPLSDVQKRYAVDDVAYLPAIHGKLQERLSALNRESWAAEEFAKFSSEGFYAPGAANPLAGVKGVGSLDRRKLAIARELARERVALAKRLNRPMRAVLRDHLLVEIARRGWSSVQEIRTLRGLQLGDRALLRLADAVKRGQATPLEGLPAPTVPVEETAEEAVAIALTTAVVRAFCLENRIAFPLVCNKQDIRGAVLSFVRGEPPVKQSPLMGGWRREALGAVMERVLCGEAAVRLTERDGQPKLVVEPSGCT